MAALAAQTPLALVDLEVRLILRSPGGTISVRNNGGRLFGCLLPELSNNVIACSPGEAIAWVQTSVVPASSQAEQEVISAMVRPARWRILLGSPWLLLWLFILAGIVGYFNFSNENPKHIQMLVDPSAIAAAQKEVMGSYAVSFTPGQTIMTVDTTVLRIELLRDDSRKVPQVELSYQFGRRQPGGQLVLVAGNGAVLDVVSATSLRYGTATYARQNATRP